MQKGKTRDEMPASQISSASFLHGVRILVFFMNIQQNYLHNHTAQFPDGKIMIHQSFLV